MDMNSETNKPARRRSRLERTAYHEAGHAVMSYLRNRGIRRVTIVPNEDTLGHVRNTRRSRAFQPDVDASAATKTKVQNQIQIFLAGDAAEAILTGRRYRMRAARDWEAADDLCSYIVASIEEEGALLTLLWIRTRQELKLDVNWCAVEALAKALLTTETMNGREARAIIKEARDD